MCGARKNTISMKKYYKIIPLILQSLIWLPARLFFKLVYNIEIKGVKNIKNIDRGVIFASNHLSELDPIIIPSSLPFLSKLMPMFYVSMKKNFYKRRKFLYGGLLFKIWGAYSKNSGSNNYSLSLQEHIKILRNKNSLCIFPEGKMTDNFDSDNIKGGVAYICHKTNSPVIPVLIKISEDSRKKIIIFFGKALYPKDIFINFSQIKINEQQNDYKEASGFIMSVVYKLDRVD